MNAPLTSLGSREVYYATCIRYPEDIIRRLSTNVYGGRYYRFAKKNFQLFPIANLLGRWDSPWERIRLFSWAKYIIFLS